MWDTICQQALSVVLLLNSNTYGFIVEIFGGILAKRRSSNWCVDTEATKHLNIFHMGFCFVIEAFLDKHLSRWWVSGEVKSSGQVDGACRTSVDLTLQSPTSSLPSLSSSLLLSSVYLHLNKAWFWRYPQDSWTSSQSWERKCWVSENLLILASTLLLYTLKLTTVICGRVSAVRMYIRTWTEQKWPERTDIWLKWQRWFVAGEPEWSRWQRRREGAAGFSATLRCFTFARSTSYTLLIGSPIHDSQVKNVALQTKSNRTIRANA